MALLKKFLNLVFTQPTLIEQVDSPIINAIYHHDLDTAQELLSKNSSLIFEKDREQENLLFYALKHHAFDIAMFLDGLNFSLATHTDKRGYNVLHLVASKNHEELTKYFMTRHPELIYQKNLHQQYPDDLTTNYTLYQLLHQKRMKGEPTKPHFIHEVFKSSLHQLNSNHTIKKFKM